MTNFTPLAATYVKQQIALPISGGGSDDGIRLVMTDVPARPTLMKEDPVLYRRTLGTWSDVLHHAMICGYSPDETVSVRLLDPANQVISEQSDRAFGVFVSSEPTVGAYCCTGWSFSSYELLPGAPLGEYLIEVTGSDSKTTIPFELVLPYRPDIFWSSSQSSYALAGFDPGEEVIILVYGQDPLLTPQPYQPEGIPINFVGSISLIADQDGTGIIDASGLPRLAYSQVFALGDHGHYASNSGLYPPIDYFAMIAAEPENPIAWYLHAIFGRGGDREGAFNDLTRAIELAPNNAELYVARARLVMTRGDALADLTMAIELKPDHADAYYQRARLWEEGIDLEDSERAIADYEHAMQYTFNQSIRVEAQQRLDELRP